MNAHSIFWSFFWIFQSIVACNAVISWFEGTLLPSQFRARGDVYCIPYLFHGAILGDIALISWLAARCAERHSWQWSPVEWVMCVAVALGTTIPMHIFWSHGSIPACFSSRGYVYVAGWMHAAYMTLAMAIFFLFYFCTAGIERGEYIMVSSLLIFHESILSQNALYRLYPLRPAWWPAQLPRSERRQPILTAVVLSTAIAARYITMHR